MLLIGNDAFAWKPWEAGNGELKLVNSKGQWEVPDEAWGFLELVWPKPGSFSTIYAIRVMLIGV